MLALRSEEAILLAEVLTKHRPDLMEILTTSVTLHLTVEQRDELIDIVSDEMLTTGLTGDKEHAELGSRGIVLDDLITALTLLP